MHAKLVLPIALLIFLVASGCTTSPDTPPATGSLAVSSDPPGSEIYLDGVYRGTTPSTIPEIPAGTHSLELRYLGYSSWSATVEILGGRALSIHRTLDPIVIPTTVPTTLPPPAPTPEPDPLLGCWELNTQKGGVYFLEFQREGSGGLSFISDTGSTLYFTPIGWHQDPASGIIYASGGPNPHNTSEIIQMEFEYDEGADILYSRVTRYFPLVAPFVRVPCQA